ncbi:MAG TPA: pilus assembly protein PilM [Pirellulaceae bacterium]|nr:pilus assembly protein PilM [Pirellulaceae bacterium]
MEATPLAASAAALITCRHCQRPNPPARRFCGGCGQSLWERCPQCDAECQSDEQFCGSCGTDIRAQLGQRSSEHQAALDEALALAGQHEYDAAVTRLQSIAAIGDPRLAPIAQRAREEIERLKRAEREQSAIAAQALSRADELIAAQAYDQAQTLLEQIPPPLRSKEAQRLLDRAAACQSEAISLSSEIRAAVESKRYGDLLPKLDKLLALKPNHAQARQLAGQLVGSLIKSAAARLSQHRYQEALDQLDRIPAVVSTPEAGQLSAQARELNCLLLETQNAALADEQLVSIASRLVELAPQNAAAARLRAQAVERAKALPAELRLRAPNWAPVPERTLLGLPVDWLAHPTRAAASGDAAKSLREHPGQFFVAFGLALQALDLAAVGVDLMPREKGSLLSKLPALNLGGKRAPEAAWGLDLSDTALKALKLVREAKDGSLKIEAAEFLLHSQPLQHPAAEANRCAIVAQTLAEFAGRAGDLKGVKLCTNIAGGRVLGRFFELPPMPARKVAESVQYEARHQLPVALDELSWSYAIQDDVAGKAADEQPRRIVVQATRDAHVRDRLASFKAAGLAIDAVQSDCLALHSALVHELELSGEGAVAAIDVGVAGTNVVVSSPSCAWFRTLAHGGDHYSRELAKALGCTAEEAELQKRQPARVCGYHLLCEAWQPLFVQLGSEIERSLATYRKLYPEHPVRQLYGLGGAFRAQGLLRYLRSGK